MTESTIIITGASAGIGWETAKLFAKKGWKVLMGARRVDLMRDQIAGASDLRELSMTPVELDVTSKQSVRRFLEVALGLLGSRIDVLFNNAGLALGMDHVSSGVDEDWQQMIDTNVMGLLRVTRAFLPTMIQSNHGHIINMGSIASQVVYEGGSVYCATKHAVRAVTKSLRLELNGTPIRVTSIDPGMVETDFSRVRFNNDAVRADGVYQGLQPLTGSDIADCVWFSASRPQHVNIDEIVLMPVAQSSPYKVHRTKG